MGAGAVEARDAGDLRKYRTEIPNLVLEMGLSPDALALYVHLKRTAGQDGECKKGTRRLSEDTKISTGRISEARGELERRGLIAVERPNNPSKPISVTVVDLWPENFAHFAAKRVQSPNTTRSHTEHRKELGKELSTPPLTPPTSGGSRERTFKAEDETDHAEAFAEFVAEDPLGSRVSRMFKLAAAENKSKRKRYSTAITGYVEVVGKWREDGLSDEAIAYGLDEAIRRNKPGMGYAKKAAKGYEPESDEAGQSGQGPLGTVPKPGGTPPDVIEYVFANTRNPVIKSGETRIRSAMATFDFTSGDSPPYPVQKKLGGDDSESWAVLESIRTLCRRALRDGAA